MSTLKELEMLLKENKINRRDFLSRLSVLGISGVLASGLLTRPARAATPKRGGTLKLGMAGGSTADSLDPAVITDAVMQNVDLQVRNCLIELDHNSQLVPELAESWESTPDAAKWIFKLRKGVEFHNGKTLDAEDVVFSLNYHRKPDSKSVAKSIISQIKDVKADGKNTVVITLNSGNADFPFIMSDYHLAIVPAGTTDFEKGMGTGGYILESFEPGVRVLTRRNPNYWKNGRAHFDAVEIISINDANAKSTALVTGKVDAINRCDLKILSFLEKKPDLNIIRTTGTLHYTLPMLTDQAPFNNKDVRLALKYALDRKRLVKTILRGYGSVGNDHPISRTMRYYASDLPQREYDPDKAKYHLKKGGMTGYTFELHAAEAGFAGGIDTAVLYQESAKKAGINIKVVREPDDGYWKSVWMKKPWCLCYWSGRPTEDWMFSLVYASDAKWNDTHWQHDRFNKLLKEARIELDESKRRGMYAEMQRIVSDEGGVVIPMFADTVAAASNKVKYGNMAPHFELDGQRCAERWWFA